MKFIKMFALVCIVLQGFVTGAAQNTTPDFTKLDSIIKTLRSSDDQTLRIRVDKQSFVVLQENSSVVSKEEAIKAIGPKPKGAAWLKYGDTGNSFCYEIDADTVIEVPLSSNPSSDYRKVIWAPVEKYDLSNWTAFANYLIANGLYSFGDFTYQNIHHYVLSFSPVTPASINAGNESLALSVEFARHMRLSPRHPSAAGSNGFVILFHDPHWNTTGASDSLAGLRAFIGENKNRRFEFLVEGSYDDDSRNVGLATLPQLLNATAKGPNRTRMVHSLLRNYLIDTPTAYRLLYGP